MQHRHQAHQRLQIYFMTYINLTLLNSRNIYLSNECCSSAASKVPGAVWMQQ
jgi:hypothetical protein